MRAVLDTNVLIAAFVTEGICANLLLRAKKRQFDLITRLFILQEFELTLSKKFSPIKQEGENVLVIIAEAAQYNVQPSKTEPGVCRDKDDDIVPAYALEAAVDYLATGDKDLLILKMFRAIRIVTPRDF
jgi:hypothetical protein